MNRIEIKFKNLKENGEKAFIAYIMAGDPDLETTYNLVLELEASGVDIVELGVPFSDPVADGPIIQKAGLRALRKGINLSHILNLVSKLRKKTEIPIILMSYFNIIFHQRIERFVKESKSNGVDGVIIPDLIPEEANDLLKVAKRCDFYPIFLASPTSNSERLKKIVRASEGFIYYVSLTGVTGIREMLPLGLKKEVLNVKKFTSKPLCVGFGISHPQQVRKVLEFSDGVVVGSAIVSIIEKNLGKSFLVSKVGAFVKLMLNK
ncbi:MAG: tryptophan synthase subunit alpha [Candidatus Omnitrophica bacterium]|nr:tryptophan synthase subunit alpha [Candidatus Omnitrophota bacterium]